MSLERAAAQIDDPAATRDDRPRLHLTPPAGWMNDPNGLIQWGGRFHVFYQHNPDAPHWDRISWGHAVSDDLVSWEHWPVAIEPDPSGADACGCWSGCIVDDAGTPTMLYTGVREDQGLRRASICLARSHDGLRTWDRGPNGPVIDGAPDGYAPDLFRDPFVWRDDKGWAMLVGAGAIDSADISQDTGAVLLYRSQDLVRWDFRGPFLSAADLPTTLDAGGPCWECPQLTWVGDQAVLILSIMDPAPDARPSHVIGITGRVDGDRFRPGSVTRLDAGPDFYAPAVMTVPGDGPLLFGWVPEDPPGPTDRRDWAGSMTTPRQVALGADGLPTILPASAFRALRGPVQSYGPHEIRSDDPPWPNAATPDRAFEAVAWIGATDRAAVVMELRDHRLAPEARIVFDSLARHVSITRRGSVDAGGPIAETSLVVPARAPGDHGIDLRLLVDGSMLEIFIDERISATLRLPTAAVTGERRLTVAVQHGQATIRLLDVWPLSRSPDQSGGGSAAVDVTST
jgi:beta-fructofuranosidase